MKRAFFAILMLWLAPSVRAQYVSKAWNPDLGNGDYRNPVLNADYSDPDVCAVGGDFYLTASSFNCVPGLPILHSRDLVNWTIVGHALMEQLPGDVFDKPQHGKGVWAPSIRYHEGMYYIYWGDPDQGIFMVKTRDPRGPWTTPVCVVAGRGMIDPCPLWDEDGRCYLVNAWAASRSGFNSVLTVRELSADGTRVVGQPSIAFDGGQAHHTTEGPKFYKRDGWYWILCPAGGVQMGWQVAMRSHSPYGPYEARTVMAQGQTHVNGPHQGAWVTTEKGEDWFLHFNDRGAYGRVVFLQPMSWRDGWPVIGVDKDGDGVGEPVMKYRKPIAGETNTNPQESDEFDQPTLGRQWQWHANYNQLWGMPTANGMMRLYTNDRGGGNLWTAPYLLLQKTPAERFTMTAKVCMAAKAADQYGGLLVMGRDYGALVIRRTDDHFVVQGLSCLGADEGGPETIDTYAQMEPTDRDTIPYSPAQYLTIYLRVRVRDGQYAFAYSTDGKRYRDVGPLRTLKEGRWIGAKVGLFAERNGAEGNRGWLDVDWVRITD